MLIMVETGHGYFTQLRITAHSYVSIVLVHHLLSVSLQYVREADKRSPC